MPRRVFYGSFVHSISLTELAYLEHTLLGVDARGEIAFVRAVESHAVEGTLEQLGWADAQLVRLKHDEFIMPG